MKKENAFNLIEDLDIKDMSAPATIDATPSFFNVDFLSEPSAEIDDLEEPKVITNTEELKEAVKEGIKEDEDADEEQKEEVKIIELEDGENYSDWSDFSLMALRQIKNGNWELDEKELPKDLDAITLMEMYDAQDKARQEKVQEEVYSKAGEFANYIKYYMEGGSKEVIDDALAIRQLTELDIDTEENQKIVIEAVLEMRGLEDDVIEDTIETIFDKGKGKAKAQESQDLLKKHEEAMLKRGLDDQEKFKENQKVQYEEYVKTITSTVRAGKVGGLKIDKKKQDQLLDAMFKQTEVIEVPGRDGKPQKVRVTKSKILFDQIQKDPQKTAAMVLWLLDGGDFEGIKDEIKEKKDDSLREILKGRKSGTVVRKQNQFSNGFEVLANRASQLDN